LPYTRKYIQVIPIREGTWPMIQIVIRFVNNKGCYVVGLEPAPDSLIVQFAGREALAGFNIKRAILQR
jgi:hypothetical protein